MRRRARRRGSFPARAPRACAGGTRAPVRAAADLPAAWAAAAAVRPRRTPGRAAGARGAARSPTDPRLAERGREASARLLAGVVGHRLGGRVARLEADLLHEARDVDSAPVAQQPPEVRREVVQPE